MKNVLAVFAIAFALAGCAKENSGIGAGVAATPQGDSPALTDVPELSRYSLGEPIEYGRLAFIPVVSKDTARPGQEYATLMEAKKHGWVEIIERPGDEEVSRLRVRNTGPKPLLLLGGELLLGGKQDRIVAHDTIVPAESEMDVPVYCVEHGRWDGRTSRFETTRRFAPDRVRRAATYKGQQEVWNNVAEYNRSVGAEAAAKSTVNAGLSDRRIQAEMQSGLAHVLERLRRQENVVGIVVAMDGEVQTLELFGDPALFEAAREPLLTSFLSEAAVVKGTSTRRVEMREAAQFVSETLNSRRKLKAVSGGGYQSVDLAASSPGLQGRELADRDYEGKPASKPEGLIHGTYSKER